jgi:hypothetical protein
MDAHDTLQLAVSTMSPHAALPPLLDSLRRLAPSHKARPLLWDVVARTFPAAYLQRPVPTIRSTVPAVLALLRDVDKAPDRAVALRTLRALASTVGADQVRKAVTVAGLPSNAAHILLKAVDEE